MRGRYGGLVGISGRGGFRVFGLVKEIVSSRACLPDCSPVEGNWWARGPVRDEDAGSGVAPDHPQAREWATAPAGRVGKLLGGSFLAWLEGPPRW